ncbi:MAG: caspase family protein [Bacteroidales bacterium]|nr:caspase family protein [Bacteroidales bacterium]
MVLIVSHNGLSQTIKSGKSSIQLNPKIEAATADNLLPAISFISPRLTEGEIFYAKDDQLTLIGKATAESGIKTLFINAVPITLADDNLFATTISFKEGENDISIIAMDNLGNYIEATYLVNYKPEIIFRSIGREGIYYALLIGIDNYDDQAINDLDNPIADATKLSETLMGYYSFDPNNVILIKNAKRNDIIMALDEIAAKITPNDNLLLFYAGHGWWDDKSNVGYWLPSDAKQTNKAAWFRNSTLCDYLKEIDTKHTLVITDACFGGSIFSTRSAFSDGSIAVNMLYELPSRKAMTSGTLTEVPDRSAFFKYLINKLNDNQEKYLSSEQLFSSFRIAVINNSEAVPQYGEIRNVGDQGGDFIFIRK